MFFVWQDDPLQSRPCWSRKRHSVGSVVTTLQGVCRLTLKVRRCHSRTCARYHSVYRPEEEGRWALPHGELGLGVIAHIGSLRYTHHQSVPEIHQQLCAQGIVIAERTVTNLLARYEELVALHLTDQRRLQDTGPAHQ